MKILEEFSKGNKETSWVSEQIHLRGYVFLKDNSCGPIFNILKRNELII